MNLKTILLIAVCFLESGCNPETGTEMTNPKISDWNGYKMEHFSLRAHDGTQIPLIILHPNDGKEKHPVILLLHGITAAKDTEWLVMDNFPKGGNLTLSLLKNGYIVAAIDARMHGERAAKQYPDFESHFKDVNRHWNYVYDNTCKDIVTTLAYLKAREDTENNSIGIFAFSMGNFFSFKTAVKHSDEIKTIVAAVPPLQIDERGSRNIPAFAKQTKIPVLLLVASNDEWTPLENSKRLYEIIPAEDKKFIVYESTHSLPVEYIDQAIAWFDAHMK